MLHSPFITQNPITFFSCGALSPLPTADSSRAPPLSSHGEAPVGPAAGRGAPGATWRYLNYPPSSLAMEKHGTSWEKLEFMGDFLSGSDPMLHLGTVVGS